MRGVVLVALAGSVLVGWEVLHSQGVERGPAPTSTTARTLTPAGAWDFAVVVHPEVREDIPGLSWTEVMRECGRIWARERIHVAWGDEPGSISPERGQLRITVHFDDALLRERRGAPADLGITVFSGPDQHIIISPRRTRDLLGTAVTVGSANLLYGRLLGRVVAHEIGHVLLLSTTHAATGLMRAGMDVMELDGPDDAPVALSGLETRRVSLLLSSGALLARRGATPGVSRMYESASAK
jgi:hypothetical protein